MSRVSLFSGVWHVDGPTVVPGFSAKSGRGLYAARPLEAGAVLDRACSIPLSGDQCDALENLLPLGDFYFRHPENPDEGLILVGLLSLSNHSDKPNALIRHQHHEGLGWVAELVATRSIAAGAEVTHRYRCGPWFEMAEEELA